MTDVPRPAPPRLRADLNVAALFSAKAAAQAGIVRRNRLWADREIGRVRLEAEVRARKFHLLVCGTRYVIICTPAPLRILV